jgi:hypothetical protein
MLESIAASLLTKYLGDYVEGLDANNLKLNLSAGDAVLTNLKLKKSALETLELPITIKNGFLGKLTLQIPWSSLGSKAAIIRIDGVYLVAGPKSRTKATAEEEKIRKQQVKQQRLQLAELLGLDKPEQQGNKNDEKDKKKDDGFFSRMAMKVVDNVQIFLDNIHIRYEDDVSNKESPFAFGITLDSLHAQSCNGSWEPAFLAVGEDVIHKLVTLSNLAIYWNTTVGGNAKFVNCDSAQEMSAMLKSLIPLNPNLSEGSSPYGEPDHHYLLRPVSGVLKATLDRGDLVLTRPRLKLDAELHHIGIALNASQFQRAQDLLEHFSLYVRSLEYMEHRPPVDVRPVDNPKLWWKFVLTSVRESVSKKYKCWTWEAIQARSRDRTQYLDLYEKKLALTAAKMSSEDQKALEALEVKLEYGDLLTFRQLAHASWMRKQLAAQEKKKNQGWFGGWFGGGSGANDKPKDEKEKQAEADAAMKELYAAIGFVADQVVEKETVFPKDYIKTLVNFKISDCCLELRQDDLIDTMKHSSSNSSSTSPSHSSNDSSNPSSSDLSLALDSPSLQASKRSLPPPVFLSFDQKGFVVSLQMREGSMSVVSSLETTKMSDFHTLDGKELIMLEPDLGPSSSSSSMIFSSSEDSKNLDDDDHDGETKKSEELKRIENSSSSSSSNIDETSKNGDLKNLQSNRKFMDINFDMNPLDAPGIDIRVAMKLQPVQSVLSRALIDRIVQFFERKTTRAQLDEISSAASATWDDLRNRAQTSIKYTLEKRTKLKIDVELAAPRFTIPKNFIDPTCPAIVIDLGTIVFKSDPDARSNAVAGPMSNADISEDYFYDRFDLSMKNLHAMVVGGQEAPWAKSKSVDPSKYVVINKFDLDVILKTCATASPDLPLLKISGALNRLALDVTDYRINWILDVLEAVGKSTLPPKVLSESEKAAMRLLLAEMRREEQRKAKMAAERAAIEESLQHAPAASSVPSVAMVHRRRKQRRHVADIGEAPGTPVQGSQHLPPKDGESQENSSSSLDQNSTPSTSSILPPPDDPHATVTAAATVTTAIDPKLLRKQLEVDFKLGDLSVTLHKSVPIVGEVAAAPQSPDQSSGSISSSSSASAPISAPPSTPLTTLALKTLTVKFSQSNHWMTVALRLGAFVVEDKFSPGAPNLVESGTYLTGASAFETEDLVELKYRNVPRSSVAFDRVEHEVTANFGTLKINLNRVTIACLMQVGNDFAQSMKQAPKESPEEAENRAGEKEKEDGSMEDQDEDLVISKQPPRTDISLAKLDVQLGALIVCMQKENSPFMQFDVARSHMLVDIRDDSVLHISGYLGGICLAHPEAISNTNWPKLVSISGDKILHFQFSKFNRASPTYPGYDLSLLAQMSSLQVNFVNASIQELVVYFGAFDKMRKAIELTTAYYYNASIDAVRQAAEAATKVRLQVTIQNPTIVVPQSSTNSRHILLDLGKITLHNSWQTLDTGVELETMEATVTGLNLKALTDPSATDLVKNLRVINDSNLNAIIKRPLSGNSSNSSPSLALEASLDAIDLNFTEDHLALVFGILSDNLGEKPSRPDQFELQKTVEFLQNFSYSMDGWNVEDSSNSGNSQISSEKSEISQISQNASSSSSVQPSSDGKPKAHLNMSVHASLKQVSLTVYKGSGQNPRTLKSTSLGTFAIKQLLADYQQFSDSVMNVDVKLGDVVLEDKRIDSENKFRRIWAPNLGTSAVSARHSAVNGFGDGIQLTKPQFALNYKAEPSENFTSIKMELFRPRLYLIPDAIKDLYEYAMDNVNRMTKSLAQLKASSIIDKDSLESLKDVDDHRNVKIDPGAVPSDSEGAITTMSVEVLLTSPELCVVENTEKSDPVALILHLGESKLRLFMTSDGQQKLDLGVQKLDAYKCILDAEHSDTAHDIVKILQPLSLGVNMGTSSDSIRRMAVEVGDLASIISFNDIKLFMDVYASYQPLLDAFSKTPSHIDASAEHLPKEAESAIEGMESNISRIEHSVSLIESDLSIQPKKKKKNEEEDGKKKIKKDDEKKSSKDGKSSSKDLKDDDHENTIVIDRTVQTQLMIVTVNRIVLSLLNDRENPDYTLPVAEQSMENVKVILSMFESGGMEALVSLSTLELKAYNNRLAAFEPVIEPWGMEVNFLKSPLAMGLHLVSQEMMDINITKSLLDTTFGLLKLVDDFKSPERGNESESSSQASSTVYSTSSKRLKGKLRKKRVSFNPYVIRNETIYPVAVRLTNEPNKVLNVSPGEEIPISLHVNREDAAKRVIRPEMDIDFPSRSDFHSIGRIPISRIATFCHSISQIDLSMSLVVDIAFEQGSKIVTLRGNRLINNDTNVDVEISVKGATSLDWNPNQVLVAPANGHVSLPIEWSNYSALRFRPKSNSTSNSSNSSNSSFKWHEWTRGDDQLEKSREALKRAQRGHHKREASRMTLFMCVDEMKDAVWVCRAKEVEKSVEGNDRIHDFVMTLSPALVIENGTCADLNVVIVNQDSGDSNVIAPQDLSKATEIECYEFSGWSQLSQQQGNSGNSGNGLSGISIAIKLPGFSWSSSVRFAEHARWVPARRGNAKKLLEPLKLVLGDETMARPLELLADVKLNDHGTCHMTIYSEYWLINQTGLNLFYKSGESSKALESAGQRTPAPPTVPERPLLAGDPSNWYDTLEGLESTDYVYAQNRFFFGHHKLSIKVEDSPWSPSFPLGIQNEGMITINDKEHSGRQYDFGVRVKPAPGRFWRTKLVRIYPAFILVNKASRPLRYRQEGNGTTFDLQTNQQLPFHWPVQEPSQVSLTSSSSISSSSSSSSSSEKKKRLLICSSENRDSWSPPFALDVAGGFQVRLRNEFSESDEESTLDVIVKPWEGTTFVIFGDQSAGSPVTVVSYELQNTSPHDITIRQKNSNFAFNLASMSTVPFCWDVPQVNEPMIQLRLSKDPSKIPSAELSLDIIAKFPETPVYRSSDGTQLRFEVMAQGPKKVLIISDPSVPSSQPKQSSDQSFISSATFASSSKPSQIDSKNIPSSSSPSAVDDGFSIDPSIETQLDSSSSQDRLVSMNFKVSLKGIGISVIDTSPQELLYFSLQTLFADVQVSNIDQTVELKIGMAQMDNQLYLSPIPIALYSTPNASKPFFHATLVRDCNVTAVQFFKYFAVQLQEIELAIHEVFLYRLLSFTKFVTDYLYAKSEEEALQKLLQQTDSEIPKLKDEDLSSSDMYYFELFHLNPVKVLVSFMTSIDLDASEEEKNGEEDDEDRAGGGLSEILGYVGILTDIERAPIELNALMLQNPFCNKNELMERITKHYTMAGLKQAYKIVGSADFLGNPVSLVSNLGTGVKDFFYEPAMGIVESPAAFGKGIAKGTKSLVLKTTYAIFDTASKLTGTVAKVGAKLTMDDDYQRERAIRNQTKARHAGEGIVYGARDFGIGIYKGITGIVLEPIKGGQQEGAVGVFKGIGKGLAGIVLKPVVGAVDLVTRTTEGIKNTTTYMDEKSKAPIRPPRHFGSDGLVRIFDYERAAGQLVLRTLSERRGRRDIYESHVILKDKLVLISKRHFFLLEQDKLNFGFKWQMDWKEKISNIAASIIVIPSSKKSHTEENDHPDQSFTGLVMMIDPLNGDPRQRRIRMDAKQAGAVGKRLTALNVAVKRAHSLAEIAKPPPVDLISGVPINASPSFSSLDGHPDASSSSHSQNTIGGAAVASSSSGSSSQATSSKKGGKQKDSELKSIDQLQSMKGQQQQQQQSIETSTSHQNQHHHEGDENAISSSSEMPSDLFTIKINPKAGRYAALPDWHPSDDADEDSGEEIVSSAKRTRRRKAKANETTRLLGEAETQDQGCCSCSCNVM